MKKDISPEERLLRLIKGEKSPKSSQLLPIITSFSRLQQKISSKLSRFQVRDIQRLLWGVLFISFLYLLICLICPLGNWQKDESTFNIKEEDSNIIEEGIKSEVRPYNFYQEVISGRQIFGALTTESVGYTQIQSESSITERIKDLNLLGIISGDNPQAIIEDKKAQKTYFLKKGEFLGEIKIEDIGEGKISLEFQGQRFDLFL